MAGLQYSFLRPWFIVAGLIICAVSYVHGIDSSLELQPTVYEKIAQENLKAVVEHKEESGTATLSALINDEKEFYQLLEESLAKALTLPKIMKRSAVFNLLAQHEKMYRSVPNSLVLDAVSWKDLELLCGPKTDQSLCLAEQIDRASTECGSAVLYRKIIEPLSTVKDIRAQQHTVKMLLEHEDFFNAVDAALTQLSDTEDAVLSFFGEDLFQSILLQNQKKIIGQDAVPALKRCVHWFNTSEVALELRNLSGTILNMMQDVRNAIGAPALCLYGLSQVVSITSPQILKNYSVDLNLGQLSKFALFGSVFYLLRSFHESQATDGLVNISDGIMGLQIVYWSRNNIRTGMVLSHCLQTKLIHVARYMNNMQQVVKKASNHKALANLPMIRNLRNAFRVFSQDPQMSHLLALLATNTFKGEASFFSYQGRVLSAYRLMHELKHTFTPLLAAVGELDAQMSIARLYKEFCNERVTFCFPTCIGNEVTPAISITDFWNPIIPADCVVANSLDLGDRYGQCRNIAVSGPNAGGKTTITVRGLPIALILAQSLGIAPAQSLEFTPFSKIITYLNITDDLAQGNSKFTAGVERALQVLDVARTTQDGFVLAAVDEALDGAAYEESQAAAYALFEAIGLCDRTICLTTTHLPLVHELEKTGTFVNYKVSVTFDEQGNICYPYKLEKGRADQNIVFKVLDEKGFAKDFVARSAQMLEVVKSK